MTTSNFAFSQERIVLPDGLLDAVNAEEIIKHIESQQPKNVPSYLPEDPVAILMDEGSLRSTLETDQFVEVLITIRTDGIQIAQLEQSIAGVMSALASDLESEGSEVLYVGSSIPVIHAIINTNSFDLLLLNDQVASIDEIIKEGLFHEQTMDMIGSTEVNNHGASGESHKQMRWVDPGPDWAIVVIDDGVRLTHEAFDLNYRIRKSACFNADKSCGNGQASDLSYYAAGKLCGELGRCDHGTHVAGTALGDFRSDGLMAADGAAPRARLHAIDVMQLPVGGNPAEASSSDLIKAFDLVSKWILQGEHIASVNLSLGGSLFSVACDNSYRPYTTAIGILRARGVSVIAAAGNDGSRNSIARPACISSVFSVGSVTGSDRVSSFSNSANIMDIWAPGSAVTSAGVATDKDLATKWGTSMATPHVAGVAALIRSCMFDQRPPIRTPNSDDYVNARLAAMTRMVRDTRSGGTVLKPRLDIASLPLRLNLFDQFTKISITVQDEGKLFGWTGCSTREANEPMHGADTTGSAWHSLTFSNSGTYRLSTCNSQTNFDTVLAVYTGDDVGDLTRLAVNDDAGPQCDINQRMSSLTVPVQAGVPIRISVSGNGTANRYGSTGHYKVDWQRLP